MKSAPLPRLWPFVLLLAAAVCLNATFTTGGTAYTKRLKTKLLSEPKPTAPAIGEVGFAQALTITNVQGPWLQVNGVIATGWVYNGNISATKPEVGNGADGLPLTATETSASAAARGFDEVVVDYANRHNLGSARTDLDWMLEHAKQITDEDVDAYLKAHKKGEYK